MRCPREHVTERLHNQQDYFCDITRSKLQVSKWILKIPEQKFSLEFLFINISMNADNDLLYIYAVVGRGTTNPDDPFLIRFSVD